VGGCCRHPPSSYEKTDSIEDAQLEHEESSAKQDIKDDESAKDLRS
jgi:hypothetical protein